MKREVSWFVLGYILVFVGFLIILLTIIYGVLSGLSESTIHGGAVGCIIVFFIPICFGAGTDTSSLYTLFVFGYIIIIIMVLFTVILIRKAVKVRT